MNTDNTKKKLIKNALIGASLSQFSREEKHFMVQQLLQEKGLSQRELARQIGVPYSTVHDWASLRQDNKGENKHVSFSNTIYKLKHIDVKSFNDWGRIEEMKELCEELLKQKNVNRKI